MSFGSSAVTFAASCGCDAILVAIGEVVVVVGDDVGAPDVVVVVVVVVVGLAEAGLAAGGLGACGGCP
jgi:hypothetical protein